ASGPAHGGYALRAWLPPCPSTSHCPRPLASSSRFGLQSCARSGAAERRDVGIIGTGARCVNSCRGACYRSPTYSLPLSAWAMRSGNSARPPDGPSNRDRRETELDVGAGEIRELLLGSFAVRTRPQPPEDGQRRLQPLPCRLGLARCDMQRAV